MNKGDGFFDYCQKKLDELMKNKKEEIINKLFEASKGMEKKDFQKFMDEICESALDRFLADKNPKDFSSIKPIFDKIFEICPSCTFIPLAYSYNDYTDVITSKDWDELVEVSENHIASKIPQQNDEMTIGKAKEMYRLWEEASKKCKIQEGTDKNVGDYTENTYYDIIGYDKETNEIITLYDVNNW